MILIERIESSINRHGSSIGGYNSAGDQQTNNRGICISQYVYAPKYGTYYFEFVSLIHNLSGPDNG